MQDEDSNDLKTGIPSCLTKRSAVPKRTAIQKRNKYIRSSISSEDNNTFNTQTFKDEDEHFQEINYPIVESHLIDNFLNTDRAMPSRPGDA